MTTFNKGAVVRVKGASRDNKDKTVVAIIAKAVKHARLVRGSPQTSRGDQMEVRSLGWSEAHEETAAGEGISLDGGGLRLSRWWRRTP